MRLLIGETPVRNIQDGRIPVVDRRAGLVGRAVGGPRARRRFSDPLGCLDLRRPARQESRPHTLADKLQCPCLIL